MKCLKCMKTFIASWIWFSWLVYELLVKKCKSRRKRCRWIGDYDTKGPPLGIHYANQNAQSRERNIKENLGLNIQSVLYEPTKVILRIYVLEIIVHLLLCDPATVQFMPLNHRLIAYDASQQQSHEFVLRCNIIIAFIVITWDWTTWTTWPIDISVLVNKVLADGAWTTPTQINTPVLMWSRRGVRPIKVRPQNLKSHLNNNQIWRARVREIPFW